MGIIHPKLGLKLWSHNIEYIELAKHYYQKNKFAYIELYVLPGTLENLKSWQEIDVPFIIHHPHEAHGFNLAENKLVEQVKIFKEVAVWADKLNSGIIIVHPGYKDLDTKNLYIFIKEAADSRIVIENMPALGLDGKSFCQLSKFEDIEQIIKTFKLKYCLDYGHLIASCNYWQRDLSQEITRHLALNPVVIHLSDGDNQAVTDSHLSIGKGNYDFKLILSKIQHDCLFTLETPKKLDNKLVDFISDCNAVTKLIE